MTRRSLGRLATLGIVGARGISEAARAAAFDEEQSAAGKPGESANVTSYTAGFIVKTRFDDLPGEVMELAKKSILDGLGLALCGSVAKSGEIVRNYLKAEGLISSGSQAATVIGSSMKAPARFAAFANAVGIHADDYDDTQLAVAEGPRLRTADASHRARACRRRWRWRKSRRCRAGSAACLQRRRGSGMQDRGSDRSAALRRRISFDRHRGVFGAAAAAAKLCGFDRRMC